jgi:hypothetical protein
MNEEIKTKVCSKCGEEKDIKEFVKNTKTCKQCIKIYNEKYQKEYYIKNKESINKKHKEYYKNNIKNFEEYRLNNKDKINEYRKEYYKDNIETHKKYYKIYSKEYYINHPEKLKEKHKKNKEYYYNNKHKFINQKIDIICIYCGKPGKAYKSNIKKGYGKTCSRICRNKYYIGELSSNWQNGISYGKYCSKFNKEFKERVRAFFDYQCFVCGKDEEENVTNNKNNDICNANLSVHHVCYNKKACCDETPRYFVPLCIKHHMKTNKKEDRTRWEEMFKRCLMEMYDGRSFYTKEEYNKIFNED